MRTVALLATLASLVGLILVSIMREDDAMTSTEPPKLSREDQRSLLHLAREALAAHLHDKAGIEVDETTLGEDLLREAACFVTLTKNGQLRGCILDRFEAHESIYRNVMRNVILAATTDYRFPPVGPDELPQLAIEISVLGVPYALAFEDAEALLAALRPGEDGVILTTPYGTATYLPQVWEQIPDPEEFLSSLCQKHGAPSDCWAQPPYPAVQIYHVLHFAEPDPSPVMPD